MNDFIRTATGSARGIGHQIETEHNLTSSINIPAVITAIPAEEETRIKVDFHNPDNLDLELLVTGTGSDKVQVVLNSDKQSAFVSIINPVRADIFDLTINIFVNGRPMMPYEELPVMEARFFNTDLESLSVYPGDIIPGFVKSYDLSDFNCEIPSGINNLEVTAGVRNDLFSSFTVNELTPDSGGKTDVPILYNTESILIIVTADSGIKREYTLKLYMLEISVFASPKDIEAVYGYGSDCPYVTVNIYNNGTEDITVTSVSVTGSDFNNPSSPGTIAIGSSGSFTVTPKLKLKTGSYPARVSVTYTALGKTEIRELDISFTVTQKTITITGVTAKNRVYDRTADVELENGALQGVEIGDIVGFDLGTGSMTNADAGTGKAVETDIKLTGADAYNYILTQPSVTVAIDRKTIYFVITPDPIGEQTYTRSAITPALTVRDGTTLLTLTTDYTVTYSNNINTGEASVTVTGTGNYTGSKNLTFTINPKDIASCTITISDQIWTGEPLEPTVTVRDGSAAIAKDTDYTVDYSDNTDVGTANVTVTGIGNYTGSKNETFTIVKADGNFPAHPTVTLTYTPGMTLASFNLNPYYAWVTPSTSITCANTGQSFSATYTDPSGGYSTATGTITITVNKASCTIMAPTTATVTSTSVILKTAVTDPAGTGHTIEYARSNTTTAPGTGWQTSTTFSGLTPNTTYYFFARATGSPNYNDTTSTASAAVVTSSAYTVTYNGNGSTSGTVPVDSNSPYEANATVTVLGNTGSLARTGYTFNGWNTNAGGTGTARATGDTFQITSDVTLYAQWTPIQYTIAYNANGGTGSMANTTHTYGSPTALRTNAFTRTGYTFAGWSTTQTGSVAYADGYTGNIYSTAGTRTLYAVWTANTYTVTFDANASGGTVTGPSPTSKSVTYNSAYGELATISRAGHSFNGWYTAATGGTKVETTTTVTTANIHTLYAQWTPYEVTFVVDSVIATIPVQADGTIGNARMPNVADRPAQYNCKITRWYYLQGITSVNFTGTTVVNANLTVTGVWGPYELGETGPGGGKIYYRDSGGFTYMDLSAGSNKAGYYLEAAPVDISSPAATLMWASSAYWDHNLLNLPIQTDIGMGAYNTRYTLAMDSSAPAAKACMDYVSGGKSDWWLPSLMEMAYLAQNKSYVGNLVDPGTYWTSTQLTSTQAYVIGSSGTPAYSTKSTQYRVRPVRAF